MVDCESRPNALMIVVQQDFYRACWPLTCPTRSFAGVVLLSALTVYLVILFLVFLIEIVLHGIAWPASHAARLRCRIRMAKRRSSPRCTAKS